MIKKIWFLLSFPLCMTCLGQTADGSPVLFDTGWKFFKGGFEGAQAVDLDDSSWRSLDLPHDWSIEDIGLTQSPFDSNAVSQVSGGFTTGGTAWYRKTIMVPANELGNKIRIVFDGVYMNADVWLNGELLGNHPYGYSSFWYDLTSKIRFGQKNVLAVQVKNEGLNSRWYSGSGINRHVWIQLLNPAHLVQWGTQISATQVTSKAANLHIRTAIENNGTGNQAIQVVSRVLDPGGKTVVIWKRNFQIKADQTLIDSQDLQVIKPVRWSTEDPSLYSLHTDIYQQQQRVQQQQISFGIRSIYFDAEKGFLLNGKPVKLKGGCYHNDNGPLGSRSYDRAEERRVELMKASGFNAIRCSHNPPPPAFLDACDRLGMLVIDEAFDMWNEPKTPYDYHLYFNSWWKKDLESMVLRDMNHPSIIMWSIGNEIPHREKPEVAVLSAKLVAEVHTLDPGRPVTAAVNDISENKDPFFSTLDIAGYNYANDHYVSDHRRKPDRIMMGTESYALESFDNWMAVLDHPYVIGDFVWTGFDYIGEASIGWRGYFQEKNFYPWNLAYCGDIDICGWKRPQSFYRDALWSADRLALFVHPPEPSFPLNPARQSWSKWNWEDVVADWNWAGYENTPLKVDVYSSCNEVELFLNGRSLGRKPVGRNTQFRVSWEVPWQPGELKAVGFQNKKQIKEVFLFSSGEPAQIFLSPDRSQIHAAEQDLSYVTVELQDKDHHLNSKSSLLIHFSVEGPAEIAGVGNANPVSIESYQLPQRTTWRGKCLVVLKSTGKAGNIVLHASADGLPGSSVTIQATANPPAYRDTFSR